MTMLLPAAAWSAIGDTFTANATLNTNSTVEMTFIITGDNTCEVYGKKKGLTGYTTSIDKSTSGAVVIPEQVTCNDTQYTVSGIQNGAFISCTAITSITIPSGVTSVGTKMCQNCTALETITINGSSLTKIGDDAFYGCSKLSNINLPNSVTTIGKQAFDNCVLLEQAVIGDGITSIGEQAFMGCEKLSSISLPQSLTNLGYSAFYNCTSLATVTNNSKITSIESTTFYGCSKLSSFSFNTEITNIGDNAFENSGLTSITIPATITSIGTTPFTGCSSLTEATVNCALVKGMFSGCSGLKTVNIGDDVTIIPSGFFEGTALESFTIGSGITQIGSSAFKDCTGLTSMTIPDNVTTVGLNAFEGCTGLTSFIFSGTPKVKKINDGTFKDCTGLTSFTIPASVTSIGASVFDGCTNLATVTNNATLTSIGDEAFRGTKITSLALAEGLTSIGNRTFANITTLTDLTIPSTVQTIGAQAFLDCSNVTALTIPASAQTILNQAFANCTGLTAITLPATLTSVGEEAFSGCTAATELTIANGLTTIGKKAFNGCTGIKSVTIPSSVTSIAQEAFNGCTALQWIDAREATSLTPGNTVRAWTQGFTGYDMFCGTPASCVIYLPKGYAQTDIAETYRDQMTNDVFTDESDNATCPDYQFDAAKAVVLPYGFTATKATATRSFTAQQKGTVYLPFAIGETDAAGLGKFYEFDKVDGDVVSFKSATATEGGKAYLFEPASALTEIVANNAAVVATAADETTEGLKGVYEETTLTGDYYVLSDGKFTKTSNPTINPTEAYIVADGATASELTIKAVEPVNPAGTVITIGTGGYSTFCSSIDVDFSGWTDVKAWVATGYNNGNMTMQRVMNAEAGTGVLLTGEAGATATVAAADEVGWYSNLMVGVLEETTVSQVVGSYTNFYLTTKNGTTGFFKVASAGVTIGAGKAYLQLPTTLANKIGSGASARSISLTFEDETTGISETVGHTVANQSAFDLQGRRVAQPKKGLYIVNGKKVMFK